MAKRRRNPNSDGPAGWEERENTARLPWWQPDDDGNPIEVRVLRREEQRTRYGDRGKYVCELLAEHTDEDGEVHAAGKQIIVWESAALRDLAALIGSDVRIQPAGRDGNMRGFRIFVRG